MSINYKFSLFQKSFICFRSVKMSSSESFLGVIIFERVGITQWNITILAVRLRTALVLSSLGCVTTDEAAFLQIISGDKSNDMTNSEGSWRIDRTRKRKSVNFLKERGKKRKQMSIIYTVAVKIVRPGSFSS